MYARRKTFFGKVIMAKKKENTTKVDKYLIIMMDNNDIFSEMIEYNFENVMIYKSKKESIDFLEKNKINKLIFVGHCLEFDQIIFAKGTECEINFIIPFTLQGLSSKNNLISFNHMLDYNNKLVHCKIGVLDKNLFEVLKNKQNIFKLDFDIRKNKYNSKNDKTIGMLNNEFDCSNGYFNSLSAIGILNKTARVQEKKYYFKQFNKVFPIDSVIDKEKFYLNNSINLNINFDDNNPYWFLKSMDSKIPCIVGNNSYLDNKLLDKHLKVNSDDNIDEIASKISHVKNNEVEIFKEYEKWRKVYTKKSKISIQNFILK